MNEQLTLINEEMTIEAILTLHPQKSQQIAHLLTSSGLHCVGCGAAVWETLRAGMLGHGKSPDEILKLVDTINKLLQDEEQVDFSTVKITKEAARKYLQILEEEDKQGWGIRFSEKAGGCGGYEYVLDYSENPTADDIVINTDFEIDIHLDSAQKERLMGCVIDYKDGLHGSGFKISNPNARSSCSCGSSYNY